MRALLVLLFGLCLSLPATAARLVSTLSNETVEITSSFDGERMTFFGNIAPDAGAEQRYVEGPFHVVVVILGPTQDRVAREKTHNFGIWLNTDQVTFRRFPSYFHVLSSTRLGDITTLTTLTDNLILPESYAMAPNASGLVKTLTFGRELIRLMTQEQLFGVQESGVNFLSDTFYSAQLTLPSNAPPGPYIAQTYVFKNGEIIARKSEGFAVRKIGFERFLAQSATQFPLLYGLACVALALFTGWLGGVIFRR
ncbi:Putative transmembrane protein (Alph_Pro_TM) [Devosia equisanguinis]|uniref:Transmembrane protein (Alph_Pro_TM) n=1 Tax=Devosia equisanguinis TaxID=2490941 RepID=A0A3S4EJV7_9HYPH|nr:TIGR02186 family protein [Devosia equisanguinis]VDS03556.1 Putative transmembrane protein (Alph_Pro_TM) [Devosia equisanguinis]